MLYKTDHEKEEHCLNLIGECNVRQRWPGKMWHKLKFTNTYSTMIFVDTSTTDHFIVDVIEYLTKQQLCIWLTGNVLLMFTFSFSRVSDATRLTKVYFRPLHMVSDIEILN